MVGTRKGQQDLPEVISLFPLPGALLLPRMRLPLHIFEPRYLAMVEDCLGTPERLIGLICPIGTPLADPQPEGSRLSAIGCAGRITRFSEHEDGRLSITLSAISRFRIRHESHSAEPRPWREALVDWQGFERDRRGPESDLAFDREAFFALLRRFLSKKGLDLDLGPLASAADEDLINTVSMICPLPPEDKQALLEAPSLSTRRETLVTLLEYALYGGSDDEVLQ